MIGQQTAWQWKNVVLVAALLGGGCSSSDPPTGEPATEPATSPGPSGATCSDQAPTYESFAAEFFASYCVRCHSSELQGTERHGAPRSTNLDTEGGIGASSLLMLDQLAAAGPLQENAFMPPSEPKPSRAERLRLGEWLACDRP
jgi:hypothetical protein